MSVTRCPEGQGANGRVQTRSAGEEDSDGSHAATAAGLRLRLIEDALRSREELSAEKPLLRQQLVVASRKVKRPRLRPLERGAFVLLASKLRHWREETLLVNRTLFFSS